LRLQSSLELMICLHEPREIRLLSACKVMIRKYRFAG
jgi:hypothetical protein